MSKTMKFDVLNRFSGAYLSDAYLSDANLRGACLSEMSLRDWETATYIAKAVKAYHAELASPTPERSMHAYPVDTHLSLKIENVLGGLRNYGYLVSCRPVPGSEQEYYEKLRDGLNAVEAEVDRLHRQARCRGMSKRTLRLLHRNLPEPCWGVRAPIKAED